MPARCRIPERASRVGGAPHLEALATDSMIGKRMAAVMLPGSSTSWGPAEVTEGTVLGETLSRVKRHHRQVRIGGTDQETLAAASQENCS